ncbi:UDP-glycosyltransferase 89B2-like [Magnolia sinica]|uniref:UDP-glycosyltransferase 89B2-like n=1 Tax=Magnolia sinica TaxID=86752 RepID=UPI002658D843|nr:UDP-glycosyltransferase 89B2-like [Magnolia sinica]
MSNTSGAHILVFPFPAQGHIIPILDLSYHLAVRGLSITILVTPKNLPILNQLLSKCPSIQTLVLPFPKYPSLPPGVENVKDLPRETNAAFSMLHALGALHYPILQWFQSHPSPPTAIISDFFLGWTHSLACQLGIPRVVFATSGALPFATLNSLWRTMPKLPDPADVDASLSFPHIPHSPKYPWNQLSPIYRYYKEGDPVSEFIKEGMRANQVSWGIVFNSFSELEGEYLEHVRKDMEPAHVWAVGPLLPSGEVGHTERGGASSVPAGDVMSWLDECTEGSVVYVCFGSQVVLSRRQMEALADGLDASGARFVWSVKESTGGHAAGEYGVVPAGFEGRVAGRGLVIRGWAPQVAILGHRSIGSFLTHCGWNSVLEAIVAGVPMLTWPMTADQFINASLLVDQLGVASRVCEGAESVPDSIQLARTVTESVSSSWTQRTRAKELSRAAEGAVREGGSSYKYLDELVTELSELSVRPTDEKKT